MRLRPVPTLIVSCCACCPYPLHPLQSFRPEGKGRPRRSTHRRPAAADRGRGSRCCTCCPNRRALSQIKLTELPTPQSVPETGRQPAREPARRSVRLPRQSVASDEQRYSSSLAVAPPDRDPVDGYVPPRTRHGRHLARQVRNGRFVQPRFAKATLPSPQETRRCHVGRATTTTRRGAAAVVARSVLGQEPCQDCERSDRDGCASGRARRGQAEAARGCHDAGWEGCTATRARDGRVSREGDEWRGPCEGGTTEAFEGTVVQGRRRARQRRQRYVCIRLVPVVTVS